MSVDTAKVVQQCRTSAEISKNEGGLESVLSLHVFVLMTMAIMAKCNQVLEFIVSESTAVFEMMSLKITHKTAYLAPPTIPLQDAKS